MKFFNLFDGLNIALWTGFVALFGMSLFSGPSSPDRGEHVMQVDPPEHTDRPDCKESINYAPLVPEHHPVKKIRITFHVFNKADGTGNFHPDSVNQADWLENKYLWHVNRKMANLQKMNLGNSPHIKDSRIQYVLEDIFYHRDDYGWDLSKETTKTGNDLYKKYVTDNPKVKYKGSSIHVLIGGDLKSHGRAKGYGDKDWVIVSGLYKLYTEGNFWMPSGLLRHELGHSLGLFHTWNTNDGCDDTPFHASCWNYNEPPVPECEVPSNNMMDYNACQCALTECQLGKIHYGLEGGFGNTKDIVIRDYCENQGENIIIEAGESYIWNSRRHLKGSLRIKSGGMLTIECDTWFPRKTKLVVERGGKLIVNGATLANDCGDEWKGIQLPGVKKDPKDEYRVDLINGARVENAPGSMLTSGSDHDYPLGRD